MHATPTPGPDEGTRAPPLVEHIDIGLGGPSAVVSPAGWAAYVAACHAGLAAEGRLDAHLAGLAEYDCLRASGSIRPARPAGDPAAAAKPPSRRPRKRPHPDQSILFPTEEAASDGKYD